LEDINTIFEEKIFRLVYQGPYRFLTTVPSRGMQTYRIPFLKVSVPIDVIPENMAAFKGCFNELKMDNL
jgi:hypothetical protein